MTKTQNRKNHINKTSKNHKNHKAHSKNILHKYLPIKPHFEETELCCSIRFYDNQPDIIKQFHKAKKFVETIQVSNKPNKEILHGNINASLYTTEFLKIHPENKFAKYLSMVNNKELGTTIGFSRSDAHNLIRWANNTLIDTKVAIFDWDGTLSVIEGLILPPTKETTTELKMIGVTDKEIAEYYIGSKKRMSWLKEMFNFLYKKNIEVYILTNNPIAACNWNKLNDDGIGPFSRANFFNVVKQIIPHMKEENILCGYETDGFKPDTFSKNSHLTQIYTRIQHWHYTRHNSSSSV